METNHNNSEVLRDPALSIYGFILSLAFLLSTYINYKVGAVYFITTKEAWCWSFFIDCWKYRLSQIVAQCLFLLMFAFSGSAAISFLLRKIRIAHFLLLMCLLLSIFIVVQDFRFRANQYYMLFWVTIVFLFAPNKRQALACIVGSLYFWSGKLKLNWEWLSGSVLYNDLWLIPTKYNSLACGYVVILELFVVWGLFANSRYIFWFSFIQFIIFHIQSFSQVGYWYPCLMFLLLSIFPLVRTFRGNQYTRFNTIVPTSWTTSTWTIFAIFATFQFIPFITSINHTYDGSARFLALHMFEAKQVCEIEIIKKSKIPHAINTDNLEAHTNYETIKVRLGLVPRMNCEPIIYYNHARNRCLEWSSDSSFINLDLKMQVRLTTEAKFKNVIDIKDLCSEIEK
jgi:hypothetical protein